MGFVSSGPFGAFKRWYLEEQSPFCYGSQKLRHLAWEHDLMCGGVSFGKYSMNSVGIKCIVILTTCGSQNNGPHPHLPLPRTG